MSPTKKYYNIYAVLKDSKGSGLPIQKVNVRRIGDKETADSKAETLLRKGEAFRAYAVEA